MKTKAELRTDTRAIYQEVVKSEEDIRNKAIAIALDIRIAANRSADIIQYATMKSASETYTATIAELKPGTINYEEIIKSALNTHGTAITIALDVRIAAQRSADEAQGIVVSSVSKICTATITAAWYVYLATQHQNDEGRNITEEL